MKQNNISLKQLRYFLIAAKHSSLRQAARELRISQPSLSAQLKLLEQALGVELFERNRGGVVLTPIGRQLLPETRAAVSAAEAIVEAAQFASQGPSGTFRLGVSPSLGPYALPWILPEVHRRFRDVKFFVREEVPNALAEGLASGTYDLIFTTMPLEAPGVTVKPLFREPVYLVVNADHPYSKFERIKGSQLAGMEILTIEEHHLFYKEVEDISRRYSARLLRDYEGTSLDAIRQMVYMEMGVAFLPALYIRSEIRDRDQLHVVSIEGRPIYRVHALAWRTASPMRGFYRNLAGFFQQRLESEFSDDIVIL